MPLRDMAKEQDVLSRSKERGKKYSRVRASKERMEAALREHMGEGAASGLQDAG